MVLKAVVTVILLSPYLLHSSADHVTTKLDWAKYDLRSGSIFDCSFVLVSDRKRKKSDAKRLG